MFFLVDLSLLQMKKSLSKDADDGSGVLHRIKTCFIIGYFSRLLRLFSSSDKKCRTSNSDFVVPVDAEEEDPESKKSSVV